MFNKQAERRYAGRGLGVANRLFPFDLDARLQHYSCNIHMTLTDRDAQWRVGRVPACVIDSTEVKESIHIGGETMLQRSLQPFKETAVPSCFWFISLRPVASLVPRQLNTEWCPKLGPWR